MTKSEFEIIRKEEGDYSEFYSYNLKCYIKRHETFLHLCGYIEIPKIHGFYDKYKNENDLLIWVHGGITLEEFDKDKLTLGFDCSHHNDLTPYFLSTHFIGSNNVYRDVEFVTNELIDLSQQIYEISPEYYDVMVNVLKKINQQ